VASDLDAPLRSEPIFEEFGGFTIRYYEFFDKLAVSGNDSADEIVLILDRLDVIEADIAAIELRLDDIEDRLDVIEAAIILILTRLTAIELRLDNLETRMTAVEARATYLEGLTVVTAIDHTVVNTVTGIQTIICTDDLTVDLILAPNDRDKVIVVTQGFQVVVDGNGKNVNGEATVTLQRRFEIGFQMEYSSALGAWFEI